MNAAAGIRRYADLLVLFPGAPPVRALILGQVLAALLGEVLFRLIDWTVLELAMRTLVVRLGELSGTGARVLSGN